jgi:hypothetical protein
MKKKTLKPRKGWKVQTSSGEGWADVKSSDGGAYKTEYYDTKSEAKSELSEIAKIHGDYDSFRVVPADTEADTNIYENPVKPRKGEKAKAFVSRCMSEEKMSFPKTKQRIAVCLSKSRKRNPLESGATISDDDDINDQASNMG